MIGKAGTRRQKVVIVGGGATRSLLARELSSKLNQKGHELVLVEARPYEIWLIAGARLVTEEGCHPGSEGGEAFVSCDKLFLNGNGSVKRGKVVSIYPHPGHTDTDTLSPQKLLTDQFRKPFLRSQVPSYGPQPNTAWIFNALGSSSLSPGDFVKMRPTLQLESHSSIWVVGDILDFPEGKRTKATGQSNVFIPNLLVFLRDRNTRFAKRRIPSPERIVLMSGVVHLFCHFLVVLWCSDC